MGRRDARLDVRHVRFETSETTGTVNHTNEPEPSMLKSEAPFYMMMDKTGTKTGQDHLRLRLNGFRSSLEPSRLPKSHRKTAVLPQQLDQGLPSEFLQKPA